MDKSVLIIGGGLGGLMTGALLAKEGYRITVLEKNAIIGGGLQNFCREGVSFDTGMHMLGGFRKGGSLYRICTHLGIMEKLHIREVDADCMDSLHYLSDGREYRIAMGREGFIESLAQHFPNCREQLEEYADALFRIADQFSLFNLKPSGEGIQQHSPEFMLPADEFIAKYIKDERLRRVVAYTTPLYSGIAGETPAYIHCLINTLYIKGTSRFEGGSQHFAEALAEVIRENGGKVLSNRTVSRIKLSERYVESVVTSNGESYSAENYICATDISHLLEIIDSGGFSKAFRERIASIPRSYSVFTLYITLKENSFPYINHTGYIIDDYNSIWDVTGKGGRWPRGLMYMTPPERLQGEYAEKIIINCPMEYSEVERWSGSRTGARPEEYYEWKRGREEAILDIMERRFPRFRECIKRRYSASPLTIRDFYNNRFGGMYGLRRDCKNMINSQIPPATKIKNLYLTGQNIGLHGICGVPLSAIITSELFLGRDYLLEKMNKE